MRRLVAGLVLAALMAALAAAPVAAATTIGGGNAVISRAYLDSYSNFVIVDTNNPISGTGALTSWSYWAGTTGQVQLLVVRDESGTMTVVGASSVASSATTGVAVTESLSPSIFVQAGDYVALYFDNNTGVVPFDGTATAGSSGTVLYTANGSGAPAVGGALTFEGAVDRIYSVSVSGFAYTFAGFFAPVSNSELNVVKAGSAVPVKFSLGGDEGLNIFAPGYPLIQPVACDTTTASGSTIATVTAGNSSLSYDATTDTYTYVWKTDKSWSGTCAQLIVQLVDGSTHTATFQFK